MQTVSTNVEVPQIAVIETVVDNHDEVTSKPAPNTSVLAKVKGFFVEHNAILAANIVKKTEEPEMKPRTTLNLWSPWAAKSKPLPPMTEKEIANQKKFESDHELDALNLWSPWAAKTKAVKSA